MNIASRLIQIGMVASIGVALANYVGKATAAEIEAIYADLIRQIEAAIR
jgi:hypothetical protein